MFHLLFYFLHCPLSGPVLTYISLLIIPCMIVYVTNKQEPWTLNLDFLYLLTKLNQHLVWLSFQFKAAFAFGALAYSFQVALQVGLLKHFGDVATVLLDWVRLSLFCFFMSFQTDWMMIRSDLCVEHWLFSDSHWIITINGKMNVRKYKLLFPADTTAKDRNNWLKPFFSWWKY